jgi:hypothetical protein
LEPLVRLGSTFDASGFITVGAMPHSVRGDGGDQGVAPSVERGGTAEHGQKGVERLQRSFETHVPRRDLRVECGQRHHTPDQVVSDEVHEELVANSVGRLAAQVLHLQHRFEAAEMKLGLPPATIEFSTRG